MRNSFRPQLSLLVILLTSLFVVGTAHAWSWLMTCGNPFGADRCKWAGPTWMAADECSIPIGSAASNSVYEVGETWRKAVGEHIINPNYWYYDGCYITFLNGMNEIALVDPSQINGAGGYTQCVHTVGSCIWEACAFSECDIKVSNNKSFDNQDESWYYSDSNWDMGRVDMLHEFTHALGLGHTTGLAIMRTSNPIPLTGSYGGAYNSANPFPDETKGIFSIYGKTQRMNVFASAQKLDGDSIVRVNANSSVSASGQDVVTVRRGNAVDIWLTVCNGGTYTMLENYNRVRLYIDSYFPSTMGTTLMETGVFMNGPTCVTAHGNYTIPSSVPAGFYWIYWKIDNNNYYSEYNENDNVVHSALNLNVTN